MIFFVEWSINMKAIDSILMWSKFKAKINDNYFWKFTSVDLFSTAITTYNDFFMMYHATVLVCWCYIYSVYWCVILRKIWTFITLNIVIAEKWFRIRLFIYILNLMTHRALHNITDIMSWYFGVEILLVECFTQILLQVFERQRACHALHVAYATKKPDKIILCYFVGKPGGDQVLSCRRV